MKKLRFLALILCLCLNSGFSLAEGKDVFRITDVALRAERAKAELCLSFSAPLRLDDKASFLSAVDLRREGKKVSPSDKDISLTKTDFCLQNLDHGRKYDFLFRKILSASGEKLMRPYRASFTVPDRKPFLSFVPDSDLLVLPRHVRAGAPFFQPAMGHALRAVNVEAARLTLYRLSDKDSLAGAWRQFTLLNLSPSESLVFARTNGETVFESELLFDSRPNVEQTPTAPLPPDGELRPGLYYFAAAPKGKNAPNLFAGQWFLVSDIKLSAVRVQGGVTVFAADLGKRTPAVGIEVRVLSRNGETLAEAKTGQDGVAFFPVSEKDEEKVALVAGWKDSNDLDILDIGRDPSSVAGLSSLKAFVRADRQVYEPGSVAVVALRAEDAKGDLAPVGKSFLKLLRPDRSVYAQQLVPMAEKDGVRLINVPLPLTGRTGAWILSWQKEDAETIAETSVILARDAARVKLDVQVRSEEEGARVFVNVADEQGRPLAFRNGEVALRGAEAQINGWADFAFGVEPSHAAAPLKEASFLTGTDGKAELFLPFPAKREWDAFKISVFLREEGRREERHVSARRFPALIGVRSLTEGASFSENGVARFEVVAVDENGRKKTEEGLSYAFFEEGRSFEWFPSDGKWDYKPLPRHRRIGGRPFNVSSSGKTTATWPVATGQYAIEIANDAGEVLARRSFEAGRPSSVRAASGGRSRTFVSLPNVLEERKENKISVRLEAPAFVNVLVFDGKIRAVFHRFMQAGDNELSFVPSEKWGRKVLVRAQALFADSLAPVLAESVAELPRSSDLAIEVESPSVVAAGEGATLSLRVQKIRGRAPSYVSVVSTPIAASGRTDLPALRLDRVPLGADGRAKISFNTPVFEGALKLSFMAWNEEQYGEKTLFLPARPAFFLEGAPPPHLIVADKIQTFLTVVNNASKAGLYGYELRLPKGIEGEEAPRGKLHLSKGEKKTLSFTLSAREAFSEDIFFDIQKPDGEVFSRRWPVVARALREGGWTARAVETKKGEDFLLPSRAAAAVHLLSPIALPDIAQALRDVMGAHPFTTEEITLWLEATSLWEEALKKLDPAMGGSLEAVRAAIRRELQLRQNDDGGFPLVRIGEPSDLASTAFAYNVLRDKAERSAAAALEWLQAKMQNAWFEEKERTGRIMAAEALTKAGKAEMSVLRYLSETSREKKLSPASEAALALALSQGGEAAEAGYWSRRLSKKWPGLAQDDPASFWEALRWASMDEKAGKESFGTLPALSLVSLSQAPSLKESAPALIALARMARREGKWSFTLGEGREEKQAGLAAIEAPATADGKENRLSASRGLQIFSLTPRAAPLAEKGAAVSLERKFLKTDGSSFDFDLSLMEGEPYLFIIEGKSRRKKENLRLVLPKSPAFLYLAQEKPSVLRGRFPWLSSSLDGTKTYADTPTARILSFETEGKDWSLAVLVKPVRKGAFVLPPARLFSDDGRERPVAQNAVKFSVW